MNCRRCGLKRADDEFPWRKDARCQGGRFRSRTCIDCMREQGRRRAKKRTREQRQAQRRAEAGRAGRIYRTRAEASQHAALLRKLKRYAVQHGDTLRWWIRWGPVDFDPAQYAAEKQREIYLRLREAKIARVARYKRRNPARNRAWSRTRLRRVRLAGTLSREAVDALRAAATHCAYCGEELGESRHTDHMDPIALGGRHELGNIVIVCPQCNLRKSCLPFDEWLRRVPPERKSEVLALYATA